MENGGAGATQEDQSGASAWWGEEQSGGHGRTPTAAAGRTAGSLGVSEGEGWLKPS